MLNAEKFKKDIEGMGYAFGFTNGEVRPCVDVRCAECMFVNEPCAIGMVKWLLSEYEELKIEPEVYKLKVDNKVEVSEDGEFWLRRHFKCVEDNLVVTWYHGATSFSAYDEYDVSKWKYARIPREEIRHE